MKKKMKKEIFVKVFDFKEAQVLIIKDYLEGKKPYLLIEKTIIKDVMLEHKNHFYNAESRNEDFDNYNEEKASIFLEFMKNLL